MSSQVDADIFAAHGGVRLIQSAYDGGSVWDFGYLGATRPDLKPAWQPHRLLENVAPQLFTGDDDPVFFWEAEQKVLGRVLPSWDQGQIGSCVSHGCGRAAQDLMLWEIAAGQPEQWPGAEVCREAIYGGSRVEVGGGRLNGDGSIGAWASDWLRKWGVLIYTQYPGFDLSGGYSVSRCREWGSRGCPDPLEPEARKHPVTDTADITTDTAAWVAIGAGKPIQICSDVGFTTSRDRDGFCSPSGSWAHCMCLRGRFVHPTRGKCFVIQNSWGDYLRDSNTAFQYLAADGAVEAGTLPNGGCFCVTADAVNRIVRQNDSDAYAGFTGWQVTRVDYTP